MLILAIFCILLGSVLTLLLQSYLFYIYFHKLEVAKEPVCQPKVVLCKLPEKLLKLIENKQWKNKKESCIAINLLFQFLFREWKDTIQMRRWFMKKLSAEFLEMQRSGTGRFLDKITIRDLHLGKDLPVIKSLSIEELVLNETNEVVETLDLCLDLDYNGRFQLAVDVDMVLGRTASLSVLITKLEGRARLQLARNPFSHWSITFYEEPSIEFLIESQFQGRQLPQIKSLITNQIRRSLRKKHTLPNYKLRFVPLLPMPSFPSNPYDDGESVFDFNAANGTLEVTVTQCSRLQTLKASISVFCTLAIDKKSWMEDPESTRDCWSFHKLEVLRKDNQPLGIMFKQEFVEERYENCVIVETVAPKSPASLAGMKKNDVIVSVDGVKVSNTKGVILSFKTSKEKMCVCVERKQLETAPTTVFSETDTQLNPLQINQNELINNGDKIQREPQMPSRRASIEVSEIKKLRKENEIVKPPPTDKDSILNTGDKIVTEKQLASSNPSSPSKNQGASAKTRTNLDVKKTKLIITTQNPFWNENFVFQLNPKQLFLNVGVWCRTTPKSPTAKSVCPSEDVLIGQASIAVHPLLEECASTTQGTHVGVFQLLPPNNWVLDRKWQKLSQHRGFNHRLCCGDITLYFQHKSVPKECKISKVSKMSPKNKKTISSDTLGSIPVNQPSPSHKNVSDLQATELAQESDEEISYLLEDNKYTLGHDFLSTQFHSAAMCNFCKKKIWLKVAYQCRSCAMICHKKCISKCQLETSCNLTGFSTNSPSAGAVTGKGSSVFRSKEVNTSSKNQGSPSGSPQHNSSATCRKNLNALFTNIAHAAQRRSSLTRSGSSHNLALPTSGMVPVSKSLPPSPHHSPSQSRKCSLQGMPYSWLDPLVLEDENIQRTLDMMMTFPCDDNVLSLAKEKGKELYLNLSSEERQEKFNIMIEKLQEAMDVEAGTRSQLSRDEHSSNSPTEKTKLAFLIAKCDERSQALTTLMLLYLSGLQHSTINTEPEKQSSSKPAEKVEEKPEEFRCQPNRRVVGNHIPKLDIAASVEYRRELKINPSSYGHAISVTAPSPLVETMDLNMYEDENNLLIRVPDEIQLGIAPEIVNGVDPIWEEHRNMLAKS